ncbi:hypothetical protein [Roseobacter sp. GAI101]|uniref:hypothetical protein n=1 Tax=Roseobacter sp. (strain GAI101) TaxID=391589 RepID=UPI0001871FE9|nr:hypothetical protein [Roseobacter sp. GAI101]EEB84863.1 conserved hypothetical protein [Roseobacter sp. GAI101]
MTAAVAMHDGTAEKAHRLTLGPTLTVVLAAALVMSALNLMDPMIRHDDYPAFFGDAAAFWNKTLHEGRWLNYIWHLREVLTPASLNFAVYQGLWAVFVASLAVVASGPKGATWFTLVLALMMMVSPSAMLISLWFNTLIPGLAVVALFAFLACRVSSATLRALLPGFVIVSFMAYTTYPLLLLAVCIAKTQERSLRDLTGLMALFCVSFVIAVLTVYAINWQFHGVFGVPVAEWREPTAAGGLAGMLENLPKLLETFKIMFHRNGFGFAPLIGLMPVMLIAAFFVLRRRAPLEALYLFAGLSVGIALVVVQVLKIGVLVPPRAFIFAWVFAVLTIVRAVQLLSVTDGLHGRLGRNAALLIIGVYFIQIFLFYGQFRTWHADTKALAHEMSVLDGDVFVYGDPSKITSGKDAGIQSREALPFRMKHLTGRDVITCHTTPDLCPAQPELGDTGEVEIHVRRTDAGTFMIFTPLPEEDESDAL